MKTQTKLKIMLIVLILFSSLPLSAQSELFIATNGNDNNSGTINSPLKTLIGARDKARSTGAKTIWVRSGRYSFDRSCALDSKDNGLKISGYKNEKVIFDGGAYLDPSKFKKAESNLSSRLHNRAQGKIFEIKINDSKLIDLLKETTAQLSMNDIMMNVARFPNIGYGHINPGTLNNGSEVVNTDGNDSQARGAKFKLYESFDGGKWNKEINRNKFAMVSGYYSAHWLKESSLIFSVSSGGEFHLMDGSRYGIKDHSGPERLYVTRLLCELDTPGEWFFDPIDNKLFIWPTSPINSNSKIGIWAGPEFISVNSASDIKIQKMTVQHVGTGSTADAAIDIRNSTSCEIAGVTFRYIDKLVSANIINGKSCGIKSCDFFDYFNGFRCYGGTATKDNVEAGKNYVENCHFTQIYSKDFYGKAGAINGAGNILRNNLIHNINGQPITYNGVDHLIERNEAFNTGVEEGDGGAFYTGNSIWSFGNILRHNFIHHNMSVPGLIGKGGFHCDDFDAGEKIKENIFYKGGWASVKFNKSAGQTVINNIFIKGFLGVRNNTYKQSAYNTAIDLLTNDPNSKAKNNYIGRMLQAIGKSGWQNGLTEDNWYDRVSDYWKNRYKTMDFMFKNYQSNKNMHAYESRYYDNLFHKQTKNKFGVFTPGTAQRNNVEINLNIFQNPNALNFKFKNKPANFPDIPFEKIGLYKDGFRCAVPNKDQYRSNIKQHFENRPAHDDKAQYNRNTVNNILYYNSGQMILGLVPCNNSGGNPTQSITEYLYDLGTPTSPVFNNYTRMTNQNKVGFYNWTNLSALKNADRGSSNGVNNINRDFLFGEGKNNTIVHNVDNGFWRVVVTWGDAKDPRDDMRVMAEGNTMEQNISTNAGEFKNSDFTVEVKDKKLNMTFIDDGGANNRWSVTRIWLRKVDNVAPTPPPTNISSLVIEAEDFTNTGGVYNDAFAGGSGLGVNETATTINYVNNGDWAEYTVDVPATGNYGIEYLISTPSDGSQIQLLVDGTVVSTTNVPNNGNWDNYTSLIAGNQIALSTGVHTIRIVASSNTTWQWNLDKIILSTGTSKNSRTSKNLEELVYIYPNPVSSKLQIYYSSNLPEQTQINIYDSFGREILSYGFHKQGQSIDVQNLSSGIYFIRISNNNKLTYQKTFIKE